MKNDKGKFMTPIEAAQEWDRLRGKWGRSNAIEIMAIASKAANNHPRALERDLIDWAERVYELKLANVGWESAFENYV